MHKQHYQKAGQHGSQADKTQLTILHFHHALKGLPPSLRGYQRQHSLNNQYKTKSQQQCRVQLVKSLAYLLELLPRPELRMYLKKSELGSNTSTSLLLLKLLR